MQKHIENLFVFAVLFTIGCVAALQAIGRPNLREDVFLPVEARFSSDGVLTIGSLAKVNLQVCRPGWLSFKYRTCHHLKDDDSARFTLEAENGRAVAQCGIRAQDNGDGDVSLEYVLKILEDVDLQVAAASFSFPIDPVVGRRCYADGQSWIIPTNRVKRLSQGIATILRCPLSDGRWLTIENPEPTAYYAQDSRAWGSGWTLRIGTIDPTRCKKGDRLSMKLKISYDKRLHVKHMRPETIAEGPHWKKLLYPKSIKAGSALDRSSFVKMGAPAGKYGWLRCRGRHFEFEKMPGVCQRFHGINLCCDVCFPTHAEADELVQRIVRLGYNSIRIHHHDGGCTEGSPNGTDLNDERMERLDYLVYKAIDSGLYITTDLYVSRRVPWRSVGVDQDGCCPIGLFKALVACHDPAFENWASFARNFLLHVNAYTRRRYIDEPALALIALVNEGGLFMSWHKGEKRNDPRIKAAWHSWLSAKRKIDPGCFPSVTVDELPRNAHVGAQLGAFTEFQGDLERDCVKRMTRFVRSLGWRGLLTNNNSGPHWIPMQIAAQDYDYVDNHFYVDHPEFIEMDWRRPSRLGNVNPICDDKLEMIRTAFVRLADKPFCASEWAFTGPGRYRGQSGLLVGAFASLQDWSGLWRFCYSHELGSPREIDSAPTYFDLAVDPLSLVSDVVMHSLYLRGDMVPYADEDGLALYMRGGSDESAYTAAPSWAAEAWGRKVASTLVKDAGFGREILRADAEGLKNVCLDTCKWSSGLMLDRERGTATVTSEKTCGGYLQSGDKATAGPLEVSVKGAAATVWVTAVDDLPIKRSNRMLVAHLTDVQGDGARYADETRTVMLKAGNRPLVEVGSARIAIAVDDPRSCVVYGLALNGDRTGEIRSTADSRRLSFEVSTDGNEGGRLLYEIVRKYAKESQTGAETPLE